ncbi:hypothetical protein [Leptospira licerasiae]|uniref:hypothetical protein n=1 Tax=Leptospira licerasiae TaxID=447106 RepID=UPI0010841CAF|nr:hypothetical protein [Leptospira licerasiae]TGM87939.1 hypothetical protein EHR05_14915 [Leptospira licerasiae]
MSESSISQIELHDEIETPISSEVESQKRNPKQSILKGRGEGSPIPSDTNLAKAIMDLPELERQTIDDSLVSSVASGQDRDSRLQIIGWKIETLLRKHNKI